MTRIDIEGLKDLLTSMESLDENLLMFNVSRRSTVSLDGREDVIKVTLKNENIKAHAGLSSRVMSEIERKLVDFSIKQFRPIINKYIKSAILANSKTMKKDSEIIITDRTDDITFADNLINTYENDPDAV